MKTKETLLLTRRDVASLLSMEECISALEQAFLLHADGKTIPPAILGIHAPDGGFHIKAAGIVLERAYTAIKINANFPGNPKRWGLPTIQGVIALFDSESGSILALMDSMEITTLRTAAATAVAAKHLARMDARTVAVFGCGNQGRANVRALLCVRKIEQVFAWDLDPAQAASFSARLSSELGIPARAATTPAEAARHADICVTCTPSKKFYLRKEDLAPGAFIAAVGADNPEKQEIDPRLFAHSKVVVDHLEQCATIGDLHHSIAAGMTTREIVHAELWEVVAGKKTGRISPEEITLFDSTGIALEDVAAAARIFERARASDSGSTLNLGQ